MITRVLDVNTLCGNNFHAFFAGNNGEVCRGSFVTSPIMGVEEKSNRYTFENVDKLTECSRCSKGCSGIDIGSCIWQDCTKPPTVDI